MNERVLKDRTLELFGGKTCVSTQASRLTKAS